MKILLFDLEITPTLGWTYGQWDTNVIKVEKEPEIMCFSYKWLGKPVKCVSRRNFDTEKELVQELWNLLDEADIVIAHNLNKFDHKVANERFLYYHLGPPSPYNKIDTLQSAKRFFKNGSNSLNNLCIKLDLGSKSEAKHSDLWHACLQGCQKSWRLMEKYCNQDVVLLEKLYLELRPFIQNHPNIKNHEDGCPRCGSRSLQYRGKAHTNAGSYYRVFCNDCRSWSRERLSDGEARPDYVNIGG